ncbi:MAG TPA: four-carbon acid sugar kinase family protein, partial [Acidimicrobiales bacterium]|nr:four-carbon acid sugar kinase family protein [Acidimicrobiales bacterium]
MVDVFGSLPETRAEPDAIARVRDWHQRANHRTAVLDDDPTGSQSVHDVTVVTVPDRREYDAALNYPGATCFILTNTRSLPEVAAARLAKAAARDLFGLARERGFGVEIVSRSDSTLRGHVMAEVQAIDAARVETTGGPYDAVLFAPAFLEAGRVTANDVHWARVGRDLVPVGETEFARDASFGYQASNLKEFLAEKSGGRLKVDDVHSVSLEDIRVGGPQRVAAVLQEVPAGSFVVINAVEYSDLETVALGVTRARDEGRSFLYRTGPSFVRALVGLGPRDPLSVADIWPDGCPGGHGLVVVGSHVGLTGRQVAFALSGGGLRGIELDVPKVIAPGERDDYVAATGDRVAAELAESTVLLSTSRDLVRGTDAASSLQVARDVSAAVVDVVRAAIRRTGLKSSPTWVIAKGGITSHDVATRALGIRRAEVLGQLFPGTVSVFRPLEAAPEAMGVPYV